ncbi:MAG: YncE family protein, partial [bacterium]
MIQRLALRIAGMILLSSSVLLSAQPAPSQFKIANRFKLGGEGAWDNIAVDEATGRLFVSHGSVVQVVNEKTGDVVGTIPNTRGV